MDAYKDWKRETTNNVLFSILPSPSLTMTVKLLGRERETKDNVLFAIIRYFYILSIYEN